MRRYFASSEQHLMRYSPGELVTVGWAVAKLGTRPPRAWSAAYQAATAPLLAHLAPSQLLSCVTGVSHLAACPDKAWVAAAAAASRQHVGLWQPEQEQIMAIAVQRLKQRVLHFSARRQAAVAAPDAPLLEGSGASMGGVSEHSVVVVGSEGDARACSDSELVVANLA
jgi:hypothetical protein